MTITRVLGRACWLTSDQQERLEVLARECAPIYAVLAALDGASSDREAFDTLVQGMLMLGNANRHMHKLATDALARAPLPPMMLTKEWKP